MPRRLDEEWSDLEDENPEEVETSVFLGVPDGEIDEASDLSDPAVSRIGGLPAFLPSRPLPSSSSNCKSCSHPMPLLVQMWCPFEGSAMDRALYIWGCDRPGCQRKMGSVRAWRGLKFNRKYAAKLEKRRTREAKKAAHKAVEAVTKAEEKDRQNLNPFSHRDQTAKMPLGLGTQLFGGADPAPSLIKDHHEEDTTSEPESEDDSSSSALDVVAEQLQTTSLQTSAIPADWLSCPSYQPIYLSTISEYISPPPKAKKQFQEVSNEDFEDNIGKGWGLEGWETSAHVDAMFERFVRRISGDSEQCVRYDLQGTPLLFSSRDAIYSRLFPSPPPTTVKLGVDTSTTWRLKFDHGAIDKCGTCGGSRVFECQLMPNLINVLHGQERRSTDAGADKTENQEPSLAQAGEERKREVEKLMKIGMEWGTCLIFSCSEDCVDGDEGWREELVLVQWDE